MTGEHERPSHATRELAEQRAEGSELPGFYQLSLLERRARLVERAALDARALSALSPEGGLALEQADRMVENAIGTLSVPLGLCVNLRVDGRDRLVPMAIEEPSVIAAVSHAARIVRAGGGVETEVTSPTMEGQVQLLEVPDHHAAEAAILAASPELLARANAAHPRLVAAGGGARELHVRELLPAGPDDPLPTMTVVHVVVDVADAMGANIVNAIAEELAPELERLSGGRARLRIMTNLSDRRLATARVSFPITALDPRAPERSDDLARGIVEASVFAERDPYRATTHNKGIMNGVDAVLLALGQDWRAVEAGAHAYAARSGRYGPLATWRVRSDRLEGQLTMPLAVGVVGGVVRDHPTVEVALRLAEVTRASTLASLAASVGLAQNLGALRALASDGIQRGHMRLHARKKAQVVAERAARSSDVQVEADRVSCQELLPRVSRTFALSIEALPDNLRDAVRTAYLLCRLVDTVEDERALDPESRQHLFGAFDAALQDSEEHPASFVTDVGSLRDDGAGGALCRSAEAVFRSFRRLPQREREVIRGRLLEMSRGMRIYATRGQLEGGLRIRDLEDLERYCYFVAGTVGKLLTDLFEKNVVALGPDAIAGVRQRSVSFGIGLQLVNIVKDVSADLVRGDCFVPRQLAEKHGVSLERLHDPAFREPALRVIGEVTARARKHLARAAEYTLLWPLPEGEPVRTFCAVPLVLALATLDVVEQGDDTLRPGRDPKVTREKVAEVLARTASAVGSDEALEALFLEASRGAPS